MRRILKEPLFHFVLLGTVIFVANNRLAQRGTAEPGRIIVTQAQIASMAEGFARTWQRPPTREELDGLIQDRVREEVYCREAIALGLDKDDTVIRRRLRQKMEFVSDDITAQTEPNEAELSAYLKAHPEAFRVEQRFSFSQVYLNPDKHGENLVGEIAETLARLNEAGGRIDVSTLGDPLMLDHKSDALPLSEIAKQFGGDFAAKMSVLSTGQWEGPIESGYGVHLIFISERTDGRMPALSEVREAVHREWTSARRRETNEKRYEAMLKQYAVTIEKPEPAEPTKIAAAK